MSQTPGPTGESPTAEAKRSGTPQVVELRIPADTRHAATARVVAASLAADVGFDVDDIDDLRLAVNEAIALLLEPSTDRDADPSTHEATLDIRFRVDGQRIDIDVTTPRPAADLSFDDLADRILAAVVDRHEIVDGAVRLSKSARDVG